MPTDSSDLGLLRLCLASENLHADFQYLQGEDVGFISPPAQCHQRMADVALGKHPDGTLIELLQVDSKRWPKTRRGTG